MSIYVDYLKHHGILGMRWGVRRFQKSDGTLTPAGQKRYSSDSNGNSSSGETSGATPKMSRKQKKQMADKIMKEAKAKGAKEISKANKFADKVGLDPDDYFFEDERKDVAGTAKKYDIDEEYAKNVAKYSEMVDLAEAKFSEYIAEAKKK